VQSTTRQVGVATWDSFFLVKKESLAMKSFRFLVVVFTTIGMCSPQIATAAPPRSVSAKDAGAVKAIVRDVALTTGNELEIQVINEQGKPHAGTPINVRAAGINLQRAVTKEDGKITLSELKPGIYEITSGTQSGIYRLWAPHTAPPKVTSGILLIDDGTVVRGSRGGWQKAAIVGGVIITSGVLGGVIGYNLKDDAS